MIICDHENCPASATHLIFTMISLTTVFVPATHSVQVSHQGQAVVTVVQTPHQIVVSAL
jgi:hypothetical protein